MYGSVYSKEIHIVITIRRRSTKLWNRSNNLFEQSIFPTIDCLARVFILAKSLHFKIIAPSVKLILSTPQKNHKCKYKANAHRHAHYLCKRTQLSRQKTLLRIQFNLATVLAWLSEFMYLVLWAEEKMERKWKIKNTSTIINNVTPHCTR